MINRCSYLDRRGEGRIDDGPGSSGLGRVDDARPLRRQADERAAHRVVAGVNAVLEVGRHRDRRLRPLLGEHLCTADDQCRSPRFSDPPILYLHKTNTSATVGVVIVH